MRNREILGTSSTPPRLRTRSKASLILGTPYFFPCSVCDRPLPTPPQLFEHLSESDFEHNADTVSLAHKFL